jgi:large subunit ribosomal protein L29
MKISDIRQKATEDLRAEIKKLRGEHYSLRFRRVTDVIEHPGALRELRRDLAKIYTVIREREIEEGKKSPPAKAEAAKGKGAKA